MEQFLVYSNILLWILLLVNLMLTLRVIHWLRSVAAMQAREAEREERSELTVGAPAPEFKAKNLRGEIVRLADYAGQNVALLFVSPHCGTCQDAVPMLEKLSAQAKQTANVDFVLVSDSSIGETQAWLNTISEKQDIQLHLPMLVPAGQTSAFHHTYNPRGLYPYFCVIDQQGIVQVRDALGKDAWKLIKQTWEGSLESKTSPRLVNRFR
ncbi:MAG: redoxin domain-containing protein [Chloroflexi bacterium]|nr:redoxin domain-containing protein [Chloroflexota bacterium]